ncbi:AAA family ATPase [Thiohalocapsa sp. ML1]|jgi:predicted ATP-binding protein involved in virulence|uniref:AAA family ATPase n=1 Tax=Thiohalocapsa sp. ML1 TaxID=1431688 RepID=UPI0007322F40|nr:AAA family ATPase [Thiohalocapsa sp. ML1]
MRIDRLTLTNFKCFPQDSFELHPQFTLFVGDNGSGKTSILEGLAVAAGSWLLGIPGQRSRSLRPEEVRFTALGGHSNGLDGQGIAEPASWEPHYPCAVEAEGRVQGEAMTWRRELKSWPGRTTSRDAEAIKASADKASTTAREGDGLLPLIAHYGVCRLCSQAPDQAIVRSERALTERTKLSRLQGYADAMTPRVSPTAFVRWIARQTWISFQQAGRQTGAFKAVQQAIADCLPGARSIDFDAALGQVVIDFGPRGLQPFTQLSDGQRSMLAMVADIATRAATLNPHLGAAVLIETPGVVLIDELDLHLHPKWQRLVATALKRAFPSIQFVCTSHSPQVIGELHRDEVRLLRDGRVEQPYIAFGADSNWILDHVMAEGTSSQNQEARRLRVAVEDALDAGDLDAAHASIARWRKLLDGETAELAELAAYLDRLERLAAIEDDEEAEP